MQRRVEQADRHRPAIHRREQALEVALLERQQLVQRRPPLLVGVGEDDPDHPLLALLAEEHVLGAAQADALGAEVARLARVLGRVGVGPHAERAQLVRPAQHGVEVGVDLGLHERHVIGGDAAGRAVGGQHVALAQHPAVDVDLPRALVDLERARARHRRAAHAARHQRRVRGLAALRGQDPLRRVKASHVVGLGERAHEDDVVVGLDRRVGGEDDPALGRPGRRCHAASQHVELGLRVERRVQQRVERLGVDRGDRLGAGQQLLLDRVDREAHGGLGGPLGVARLQHVQPAVLDGELGVLHVLVMELERAQDLHQLGVRVGQPVAQLGDVARRAHAADDVLALRVGQEVARRLGRAGDLVAAEGDARARRVAAIAEDHLLDADRRAPFVGDPVDAAVLDRAIAQPRVEDRVDRLRQLLARLRRELVELAEAGGQLAQGVRVELGVLLDAALALGLLDGLLEALAGDAAHDVAEHLDEAPVGVPGEALVVRRPGQALDGLVVEAEVQHGVEHPGHRLARAAAHGDEQRVVRITELRAGVLLEARERRVDLLGQVVGRRPVAAHVLDARLGGDREARGYSLGPQDARHLGDVGALAAEQVAHVPRALGEVVDPLHGDGKLVDSAANRTGSGRRRSARLTTEPTHEAGWPRGARRSRRSPARPGAARARRPPARRRAPARAPRP